MDAVCVSSLFDNSSQDDLLLQCERAMKILYENDRDSEYFFYNRRCSDIAVLVTLQ